MRLRSRIVPADSFTDGRLLSVSARARALALVLEALAEDSGVVADNPLEIRSTAGVYLADDDGRLPSLDEITARIDELEGVTWLLRYECDGLRLAYLRGFGTRQQGPAVGLGISNATGEVSPHLPLPECVSLDTRSDKAAKWLRANRVRVEHCERPYQACATCEDRPGSQPQASQEPATTCEVQQEHEHEAEAGTPTRNTNPEPEGEGERKRPNTAQVLDALELTGRWRGEAERILEHLSDEQAADLIFRASSEWITSGKHGSVLKYIRESAQGEGSTK